MRKRQSGFTLIEIVVAFVLLTMVLATSYQLFSAGLQRAGDLEDYSQALAIAQSRIELASIGESFEEGQTGGESEDRRFSWTVAISKFDEVANSATAPVTQAFYPVRIAARVTWRSAGGQERHLDLATLVVGRSA